MNVPPLASRYPPAFWEAVRDEARAAAAGPSSRQTAALRRLVDGFARRGHEGDYQRDPELRAAYLRAFLPYEIGKVALPLAAAGGAAAELAARPAIRVVDAGCGPGSASLGVLAWIAGASPAPAVSLQLCDGARDVLPAARRLVERGAALLGLRAAVTTRAALLPATEADLVVLQNVLSETCRTPQEGAVLLESACRLVRPAAGLVVVVEPADRSRAQLLAGVRDVLALRGVGILAPCTHGGGCPMASGSAWCHVEVPLDLPRAARLGLREPNLPRWTTKLAYLVLGAAPVASPERHRLVGRVRRSRGRFHAEACGGTGLVHLDVAAGGGGRLLARMRWGDAVRLRRSPIAPDEGRGHDALTVDADRETDAPAGSGASAIE